MTKHPVALYARDSPRFLSRLVFSPIMLAHEGGPSQSDILRAIVSFRKAKLFPEGINIVKDSDQYKAAVLYTLVKLVKPQQVIETGVARGTSAVGILTAMEEVGRGTLHSIDLPNATYRKDDGSAWSDPPGGSGTGWLVPARLRSRWQLHIGDSRELLPKLIEEVDEIGIFYHDSEHTEVTMRFEFIHAWPKLANGGYLVSDNINWNSSFQEFCASQRVKWQTLYPYFGVARKLNRT